MNVRAENRAECGDTGPIAVLEATTEASLALERARDGLFKLQRSDGHWLFPLEADATITAEYVIYRRMMGLPITASDEQAGARLLATQPEAGGWAGPLEIRMHAEWRQCRSGRCRVPGFNGERREKHVAGNLALDEADQRKSRRSLLSQRENEVGFIATTKSGLLNGVNRVAF